MNSSLSHPYITLPRASRCWKMRNLIILLLCVARLLFQPAKSAPNRIEEKSTPKGTCTENLSRETPMDTGPSAVAEVPEMQGNSLSLPADEKMDTGQVAEGDGGRSLQDKSEPGALDHGSKPTGNTAKVMHGQTPICIAKKINYQRILVVMGICSTCIVLCVAVSCFLLCMQHSLADQPQAEGTSVQIKKIIYLYLVPNASLLSSVFLYVTWPDHATMETNSLVSVSYSNSTDHATMATDFLVSDSYSNSLVTY